MQKDTETKWLSQYNLMKEVIGESNYPKRLSIYDTTLRDGEQTAGLCFDKRDKLEIAKALDALGVDRIEAGMPVVSKEDREAVESIVNAGLKAEIWGFARCVKSDIDACADAGVKYIVCEIATSALKMKAWGWTPKSVLQRIVDCLLHAKERGLYVTFFAVDSTRTDLDYLLKVYSTAVNDGKAEEVAIVDTIGVATPETMYYLTKKVKEAVDVPVHVHTHNDFGLGTATTLSAIKAGANCAHVCVNGLGERTGNADIAEVAMGASLLFGIETNIKTEKLSETAQIVERATKVQLSPLKPIVGSNIYNKESGVTVGQYVKFPPSVEPFDPKIVGRKTAILLGKKSGANSVEHKLEAIGVKASQEQVGAILQKVKELGTRKKARVEDSEFEKIVKEVVSSI